MEIRAVADAAALATQAADLVAAAVADRPDALVLAATGDTPMGCYGELVRRRGSGAFDASRLRVAQLDEYLGIGTDDPRSLHGWMRRALCDPLDIGPGRVIRLAGDEPDPDLACRSYDAEVDAGGGIDLAILGLGTNGHLGFNEPPTSAEARTRPVSLTPESLESNARYWSSEPVPERAVTAGMSTILDARRVLLLVSGVHKAAILERLLTSEPDAWLPASWLHRHPAAVVIADRAALAVATRAR